jgi:nitrate reductase delta subunit
MSTAIQTVPRASAWVRCRNLCTSLAPLLEYPTRRCISNALACRVSLEVAHSHAVEEAREFLAFTFNTPTEEIEEAYTRAFYVNAACAPYVSVHLFGSESFDRGALMARLRERFDVAGFSPGSELPDHIAVLLRFVAHIGREELDDLVRYCLAPTVSSMREQLERARSPYAVAMRAVETVLAEYRADGEQP